MHAGTHRARLAGALFVLFLGGCGSNGGSAGGDDAGAVPDAAADGAAADTSGGAADGSARDTGGGATDAAAADTGGGPDTAPPADAGGGADVAGDAGEQPPAATVHVTPAAGGTVATPDGAVRIVVPAGAVPADVDITIRPLTPAELPADIAGEVYRQAWRFEPAGMQFDEPVQITFTLPLDEVADTEGPGVPLLALAARSDDGAKETLLAMAPLGPTEAPIRVPWTLVDYDAGTVSVMGETTHFTIVYDRVDWNVGEGQSRLLYSAWMEPALFDLEVGDPPQNIAATFHASIGGVLVRSYVWTYDPGMLECPDEPIFDLADEPGTLYQRSTCEKINRDRTDLNPAGSIPLDDESVTLQPPHALTCVGRGNGRFGTAFTAHVTAEDEPFAGLLMQGAGRCRRPPAPVTQCAPDEPLTDPVAALSEELTGDPATLCDALDHDVSQDPTPHTSADVPAKAGAGDHTETFARGAARVTLEQSVVDDLFNNSVYPCSAGGGAAVMCNNQATGPMPAGDYVVIVHVLKAPLVTADPNGAYQYGFVFDADDTPDDNYTASVELPNDFFADTDLWYVAKYDPPTRWSLRITDMADGAGTWLPSPARILTKDNVLVLVAPASDFPVARPPYRVTIFRHLGDQGYNPPYEWGGDVEPPVAAGLATW